MSLPIPNLDNKTFDELVVEARALISRYAPEWTDHNLSDPGITLIDLFAWLSEMQIYGLNRVTRNHILKFLELVNNRPRNPRSATVDLTFTPIEYDVTPESPPKGTVIPIEWGTKVSAMDSTSGEKVIFEVEPDYKITSEVLEDLREQNVPENVIEKLVLLENRICAAEDVFLAALRETLGESRLFKYRSMILDAFRCPTALNVSPLKLAGVLTNDNESWIDNTEANSLDGIFYLAFGETARRNSKLYIGLHGPATCPAAEFKLKVNVHSSDLPAEKTVSVIAESAVLPSAELIWEYWNGSKWQILAIIDHTAALTLNGQIVFDLPEDIVPASLKNIQLNSPPAGYGSLYWLRAMVNRSGYEIPPRLDTILLNTVSASHKETFRNEHSSGTGLPFQAVRLDHKPVLAGSLELVVQEEASDDSPPDISGRTWQEVSDFDASGPEDRHYTLNLAEGIINFGDGIQGRVPPKGVDNLNIVCYRVGGGEKGNVQPGTINRIESDLGGLKVINRKSAIGGHGGEDLDAAQKRARRDLKSRFRAITSVDFEELALQTPGIQIARAKALPMYHPGLTAMRIPGTITVVVVPHILPGSLKSLLENYQFTDQDLNRLQVAGKLPLAVVQRLGGLVDQEIHGEGQFIEKLKNLLGAGDAARYQSIILQQARAAIPSQGFLNTVVKHLEQKRLVATQLHVVGPEFISVDVKATLQSNGRLGPAALQADVEHALDKLLDPYGGGPDNKGWPFGRAVHKSEIYQVIESIEGVACVDRLVLSSNSCYPGSDSIQIPKIGLVYAGHHNLKIN